MKRALSCTAISAVLVGVWTGAGLCAAAADEADAPRSGAVGSPLAAALSHASVYIAAASADGTTLVVQGYDRSTPIRRDAAAARFDAARAELEWEVTAPARGFPAPWHLLVSPDGGRALVEQDIVRWGAGHGLAAVSLPSLDCLWNIGRPEGQRDLAAWSPTGDRIAAVLHALTPDWQGRRLLILSARDGRLERSFPYSTGDTIGARGSAVTWTAPGDEVAFVDGTALRCANVSTGAVRTIFEGAPLGWHYLASPDPYLWAGDRTDIEKLASDVRVFRVEQAPKVALGRSAALDVRADRHSLGWSGGGRVLWMLSYATTNEPGERGSVVCFDTQKWELRTALDDAVAIRAVDSGAWVVRWPTHELGFVDARTLEYRAVVAGPRPRAPQVVAGAANGREPAA